MVSIITIKNIKIDYSVLLFLVFSLFCGLFKVIACIYLIVILHELGHLIMIKLNKGNISELKLTIFGGILKSNIPNVSKINKVMIDLGRNYY